MSFFGRRTAMVATTVAVSVGALLTTAGSASAQDVVPLTTSHYVGLYLAPNTWSGKMGGEPDLAPGQEVAANCWTVGQSIGNFGNTWYQVQGVNYNDGFGWHVFEYQVAYVFAGYADGNARSVNRDPYIPRC